jgi:hypothetical protein
MKPNLQLRALLLVSLMIAPMARADDSIADFSFSRTDHQLHMLGSYGATLTAFMIAKKIFPDCDRWEQYLITYAFVMSLGIAKEFVIDSKPSLSDVFADHVGAMAGGLTVFALEF